MDGLREIPTPRRWDDVPLLGNGELRIANVEPADPFRRAGREGSQKVPREEGLVAVRRVRRRAIWTEGELGVQDREPPGLEALQPWEMLQGPKLLPRRRPVGG